MSSPPRVEVEALGSDIGAWLLCQRTHDSDGWTVEDVRKASADPTSRVGRLRAARPKGGIDEVHDLAVWLAAGLRRNGRARIEEQSLAPETSRQCAFMESWNGDLVESGVFVDARGLAAPVHPGGSSSRMGFPS